MAAVRQSGQSLTSLYGFQLYSSGVEEYELALCDLANWSNSRIEFMLYKLGHIAISPSRYILVLKTDVEKITDLLTTSSLHLALG
jgi:hypothetical protein